MQSFTLLDSFLIFQTYFVLLIVLTVMMLLVGFYYSHILLSQDSASPKLPLKSFLHKLPAKLSMLMKGCGISHQESQFFLSCQTYADLCSQKLPVMTHLPLFFIPNSTVCQVRLDKKKSQVLLPQIIKMYICELSLPTHKS